VRADLCLFRDCQGLFAPLHSRFFATLPDPRCTGHIRYRLLNLLVIAVCAMVTLAENWVDIDDYEHIKHMTRGWSLSRICLTAFYPMPLSDACSR
jgi:hypothetical protein